ncbi:response regulator [Cohnella thailandensis]|uniref:Response regulator n=1 Tax=Cohnella thailandensis TaxID=557557 RepID=A0A841T443_9BACL|nr:response regulator [Cohnella thailandensis]MBB6637405.1 response regulator [Cohnella thailandensis]MBP1976734.1 two-component system response regulator YesN [Cohnella thailandensis]
MIRVLLVEDEWLVREALRIRVPWDSYGFEVVEESANGEEALERFEALQPDVVFTDIRMPVMDGLTFIRRIRERSPSIPICILSSHTDFELVQQGIRLGVFEYMDKLRLSPEEIGDCLRRLRQAVEDRRRIPEPASRQRDAGKISPELQPLSAVLDPIQWVGSLMVGRAAKTRWVWHILLDAAVEREREFSPGDMARRMASPDLVAEGRVFLDVEKRIHAVLERGGEEERLLLARCAEEGIAVLASSPVELPREAERGLREAEELQEDLFYVGPGRLLAHSDKRVFSRGEAAFEPAREDELAFLLAGRRANDFLAALEDAVRRADARGVHPRRLVQELSFLLVRHLPKGIWHEDSMSGPDSFIGRLQASRTAEQLVRETAALLVRATDGRADPGGSREVDLALRFIREHYGEKITLKRLAEATHLNANYFATLFREKTGDTPMSYITAYRIERAKEMLKQEHLYVQDIAERVGLPNLSHFSRLFKQTTGMSPTEYRNGG